MIRRALLAVTALLSASSASHACELDIMQKQNMVSAFCRTEIGILPAKGCTADLMTVQAAEQLNEIALARRCGFMAEADKLEAFFKKTTPIVGKLYSCVDQPIDLTDIQSRAQKKADEKLASAAAGCPDDLRRRLSTDLPKAIETDQKSYDDVRSVAEQLKLQ